MRMNHLRDLGMFASLMQLKLQLHAEHPSMVKVNHELRSLNKEIAYEARKKLLYLTFALDLLPMTKKKRSSLHSKMRELTVIRDRAEGKI